MHWKVVCRRPGAVPVQAVQRGDDNKQGWFVVSLALNHQEPSQKYIKTYIDLYGWKASHTTAIL